LLEGQGHGITAGSSDGSRIVARPFTNALTNQGDAELISFPGVLAGFGTVDAGSSNLLGAAVVLRKALCCGPCFRLDAALGYRYLYYDDAVHITEQLLPQTAPFVPGTQIVVRDNFGAQNHFHGGVFGLVAEYRRGPWSVEARPRLDVGEI